MNLREHSGKRAAEAPVRRAHEFPADIVRAGGRTTKVTYRLQCARCQRASVYEAVSIKSDARVAAKFEQRGWLLGKTRNADICPSCLSGDPDAKLADNHPTNNPAEMVLSPGQLAEQLFMPRKEGGSTPVVVSVQGTRGMSRARQQAEASASSVFTKGPIGANRPTLSLGGAKPEARAAADAVFKSPAQKSAQRAQPSEAAGRSFDSDRSEADSSLKKDMSILASALTSMAEQVTLMAQVQAAQIAANSDKADLHALLAKQTEVLSRLAPVIAASQNLTAGDVTSQPETTSPAAVPASADDAQANAGGEVPKIAESAKANAETTAQETPEAAGVPTPAAEAAPPRVLPSLISAEPKVPAVSEPDKDSKAARKKPRANAKSKAKSAPRVAAPAAAKTPKPAAAVKSGVVDGEAAATGKRFRRTKAQMEEFRLEQQRLADLGLKRGRGRPPKTALTAEQIAAIAASDDPEAARAEAEAAARTKVAAEAKPEERASEAQAPAAPIEQVDAAPGVAIEPAAVPAKAGRKSKATAASNEAVASAAANPVARGRKARTKAEVALAPAAAAKKSAAKKTAKAVAVSKQESAPASEAQVAASPKTRGRVRKETADVAAAAAVAAPASQPEGATTPKKRGRPRKETTVADAAGTLEAAPVPAPATKARGGTPKAVAAAEAPLAPETSAAPAAKPRGRPRKDASEAASVNIAETAAAVMSAPAKRPRGRPRKDAVAAADTTSAPKPARKAPAAAKASAAQERVSSINWAKVKVTPDVMVLSSGKATTMQIGRKIWESAGFADDEPVFVLSDGPDIRITKQAGGRKPTSAEGSVITLKVPSNGAASLWKIKYAVEGGALFLHGQLSS